jgi:predicted RNase H-like HicB family nuclease
MPVVVKPDQKRLTAIIEPSDNVFVAVCPELDLCTEGSTPDAALIDLIEMALDYSEQYITEFERFSHSVNRAAHAPYILALRANPTAEGVHALFRD